MWGPGTGWRRCTARFIRVCGARCWPTRATPNWRATPSRRRSLRYCGGVMPSMTSRRGFGAARFESHLVCSRRVRATATRGFVRCRRSGRSRRDAARPAHDCAAAHERDCPLTGTSGAAARLLPEPAGREPSISPSCISSCGRDRAQSIRCLISRTERLSSRNSRQRISGTQNNGPGFRLPG